MVNSIHIKNFLLLNDVSISINKINILIGSQASGKSIIAKLVHFFKGIGEVFSQGIVEGISIRDAKKNVLKEFEKSFPATAWNGRDFSIVFNSAGHEIEIRGKTSKPNKTKLEISIPEDLAEFYTASNRRTAKGSEASDESRGFLSTPRAVFFNKFISPGIAGESFSGFFSSPIFVPASRSFFSSLSNNIFSFLASNVSIDPYIKEFGSVYERSKSSYFDPFVRKRIHPAQYAEMRRRVESLIKGAYKYKNKQDFISTPHGDIPLSNASSGQQEATPLLLVLSVYPFLRKRFEDLFFIEEPEAHLFPDAQGEMVSLFSYIHKECGTGFFITTHSPYVLAAMNNLIIASNLIEEGAIESERAIQINSGGCPLRFEDVSAYIVEDGSCRSIVDSESKLINTSEIDMVSERFAVAMDQMLGVGG